MAAANMDETAETAQKSKSFGLVGLISMTLAALVGSFGVSYFLGGSDTAPPAECLTEAVLDVKKDDESVKLGIAREDQVYVELDEILITIGSEPATRYLKLNLAIATLTGKEGAIRKAQPILADAFNGYLRSVELNQLEDPTFYPYMREQLSRRAELILGAAVTEGVLITDFLLR